MTHYVGNIRLNYDGKRDTISLTVKNPKAWDNEPSETTVVFPATDLENLTEALQEMKRDRDQYASWGGPGNW